MRPVTLLRTSGIAAMLGVGALVAAGCGSSDSAADATTRAAQGTAPNRMLKPAECPQLAKDRRWSLSLLVSSTFSTPVDVQTPADSINCTRWSGLQNPSRYQFVIRQGETDRELTTLIVRDGQRATTWRTNLVTAGGATAASMDFRVACRDDKPAYESCTFEVQPAGASNQWAQGKPVVVSPEGAPTVTVTTEPNTGPSRSGRTVSYRIAGG